jgi:hypothetical protein
MGACFSKSSDRSKQYAAGAQQRILENGKHPDANGGTDITVTLGLQDWATLMRAELMGCAFRACRRWVRSNWGYTVPAPAPHPNQP